MTKYTISDVAKLYKKSRATIYKDIKNGVLSREYNGVIDFSELLRVYGEPILKTNTIHMNTYLDNTKNTSEYTSKNTDTTIKELQKQIDLLTKQLEKAETREAQANTRIDTLLTLIELKTPYVPPEETFALTEDKDVEKNTGDESSKNILEKKKGFLSRLILRITE